MMKLNQRENEYYRTCGKLFISWQVVAIGSEPAVNSKILDLGKKAVAVTGGVLTYDGKNVTITNAEGKVVFDAAPVVKQTGAEVDFTAIVLAAIAVVAMLGAAIVVAKKNALFVK